MSEIVAHAYQAIMYTVHPVPLDWPCCSPHSKFMCPCSANCEGKDQCLSMVFSLELWKAGVKVAHKVPPITAPCIRPLQTLDGYVLGGAGTFSGMDIHT